MGGVFQNSTNKLPGYNIKPRRYILNFSSLNVQIYDADAVHFDKSDNIDFYLNSSFNPDC